MTVIEDLTSQVDGVATVFTVIGPIEANSLAVYQQGIRMRPLVEYTETTVTTFTMVVAPEDPAGEPSDTLLAQYNDGTVQGVSEMVGHTFFPVP